MLRKRILAVLLSASLLLATGCNVQTKDQVAAGDTPEGTTSAPAAAVPDGEQVEVTLLTQSNTEKIANVVRDQLTKAGFNVTMNIQADQSGTREQKQNGNFDIDIASWMTVTGNPDYSVRSVLMTGGDNNFNNYAFPDVDALIDKAAGETAEDYGKTYAELEKLVVDELAIMTPLYTNIQVKALNSDLLNPDTVTFTFFWEDLDFNDSSLRGSQELIVTQTGTAFTTWDPIRANDNSVGTIDCNLYIRLINADQNYNITTHNSLSRNYATADGNSEFYFILRDDTFFTRVNADKTINPTDIMVSAEDVVYTVNRMVDPDSVPLHKTYSLHESIDKVEIITDVEELESKTVSGEPGTTVRAALENGLAAPIDSLTDNRAEVDNAAGSYQVVKITTKTPFPQVLNYLGHHSGGIVDSEWVEAINSQVDMAAYDVNSDVLYGDSAATIDGAGFANTLSCSGPYVLTYMNDYDIVCVKNPGYLTEEGGANIETIITKPMADNEAALSALRGGDIHFAASVPESKYNIVEEDDSLALLVNRGQRVYYISYNIGDNSVCANENIRKAIASAINPEEIQAAFEGNVDLPYSTLSSVLDTGNRFTYTAGKTQEYLGAYYAE